MHLSTRRRNTWLLWVSILFWAFRAAAQSSTTPVISQILRLYNDSGTMETTNFPIEVAISQDFQIVNAVGEGNRSDWRFLFEYSYCCNSTNATFASIQKSNNNNLLYPPIRAKAIVALIQRGGGCNWSEKLAVARNISSTNSIHLGAVLIADDIAEVSAQYSKYEITSLNDTIQPSTPLPFERNISNMPDNDIQGTATIPTYFIPKSYGDYLRTLIANTTAQSDSSRTLHQINFAVTAYWIPSSYPSNNKFNGTYIACIVVLVSIFIAAIITGILFLRWWRRRQVIEQLEYEAQIREHTANIQLRMKARPLPIDLFNAIPVAKYSGDTVKNNSCVICFEDYVVDENELRILGCGHGFCVLCIDPWLTKKSTNCPICKYDCMPPKHQRQIPLSARSDEPLAAQENGPENDPQPSAPNEVHQPAKQTTVEIVELEKVPSDPEPGDIPCDEQTVLHCENARASSSCSPDLEPCVLLSAFEEANVKADSSSMGAVADGNSRSAPSKTDIDHERKDTSSDPPAVEPPVNSLADPQSDNNDTS